MASSTSTKTSIINKTDQTDFLMECVDIAIGEETGSPYMIKLAQERGINKGDVNNWVDLAEHYGSTDPNIFREHSVNYTTTKWAHQWYARTPGAELQVAETGGTTGAPKKNILAANTTRIDFESMDYFDLETDTFNVLTKLAMTQFEDFGIPLHLTYLATVPTGPHTIGKWTIKSFERDIAKSIFMIDMDPRFVKKAAMIDPKIMGMYLQHMQDQTQDLVKQEFPFITGLFTTGVLIEKSFPMIQALKEKGNLQAIVHGGTPLANETLKILTEDMGLPVIGFYGQSLFGTAFQSPDFDGFHIDYYPHPRMNMFLVSDENDIKSRINYGEMGTVVSQRISPETVIPALVQNGDIATLIKPKGKFDYADGARDPHRDLSQGQQMGVY
ncbi:MAG: hypothetical protein KGD64_05440 [Candidatus Heimdallarchaeota archaeon]|nr:hypothetical protein [Candidatus Heimdallarchaeota archaeon]